MPNLHPSEELKKNSVTYILGQLTQQVSDLSDKIEQLTSGTYKRISDLEATKADRVSVDRIQKALDDDVEIRLKAVEQIAIPKEYQDSLETTVTTLKVTLWLFGIAFSALWIIVLWHLFKTPT